MVVEFCRLLLGARILANALDDGDVVVKVLIVWVMVF